MSIITKGYGGVSLITYGLGSLGITEEPVEETVRKVKRRVFMMTNNSTRLIVKVPSKHKPFNAVY